MEFTLDAPSRETSSTLTRSWEYMHIQTHQHTQIDMRSPRTSNFLRGRRGPDPLCKHKLVLSSPEAIVKSKHLLARQGLATSPQAVPASTERPLEREVGWSKGLWRTLSLGELARDTRGPCAWSTAATVLKSASETPGVH